MAEDQPQNRSGGNRNLSEYAKQILIVLVLATSLFGIFSWFFGFDASLLWTNIVVLTLWLVLVVPSLLSRASGEFWRNYHWIVDPAVLILLLLLDTSWAQSKLSAESLQKSRHGEYLLREMTINIETPDRVLYDSNSGPTLKLWITCHTQCANQIVVLSSSAGEGVLFAIQTSGDKPLQWQKTVKVTLPYSGNTVTVLISQSIPSEQDQTASIILTTNTSGQTILLDKNQISMEGSQSAQLRIWKSNFLETSSIIVSLIGAIFAGIKQWEEEEKRKSDAKEEEGKRQRVDEIKEVIALYKDGKNDFPKVLKSSLELVRDWGNWNTKMQEQFCEEFSTFTNKELWEVLSDRNLSEIGDDIVNCLQLCAVIFKPGNDTVISKFKTLKSALQQDAHALLSLLRDDPQSITVIRQIARSYPDELKKLMIDDYKNEFLSQIDDLKDELGFVDLISFPLQEQFHFYADTPSMGERLAEWLEKRQMLYSPFVDAFNPYTLIPPDNKPTADTTLLIELVSGGFTFPALEHRTEHFTFAYPWDAGAALFEYARNLPTKIRKDAFVVLLTPTMIADFGMEHPRELFLHALAEQWLWELADPTMYYSLKETQRVLLGRLLRWHGGSPFAVINNLEQILGKKKEDSRTRNLLRNMTGWLSNVDVTNIRKEEFNGLIELRPISNQFTLLLVLSVDWWLHVGGQISADIHQLLDQKAEWLQMHGWALVHFLISNENHPEIPLPALINQCNLRVKLSSNSNIDAFDLLFAPHDKEPADVILAKKAGGSPGKMVRLGQDLLLQHVKLYSADEDLHIEDLIALVELE